MVMMWIMGRCGNSLLSMLANRLPMRHVVKDPTESSVCPMISEELGGNELDVDELDVDELDVDELDVDELDVDELDVDSGRASPMISEM